MELDLTAAIEVAAEAMWDHQYEDGHWQEVGRHTFSAEHCRSHAERALHAAAPIVERQTREQVARELMDWAGEAANDGPFGPRAARRRHIQAAARRIAPKPTPQEIAEALRSGNAIVCHLDDAGRPIAQPAPTTVPRPTVVCLCGSTRFSHAFREANLRETLAGRIVLSIGCDMRSDAELFADLDEAAITRIKSDLDDLHKRKIDLADEVLVLNVGGYIGDSTRSEIAYAEHLGKPIRWLEEVEPWLSTRPQVTHRPR